MPSYAAPVAEAGARAPAPGDRIGPYRLEELLGEGGMGVVFRAVREPNGEIVALKLIRIELADDETSRRRFEHEARAAREVHHRHLVPIVDSGVIDGRPYLATLYVRGRTLEERLADGPLPFEELVRVVAHVGSGLDALHAAGIVHRDVKPSNVLIDEAGSALLTDFGAVKGLAYTALTRTGTVVGTLEYLAPELLRGDEASPASDIYALGCLAYECVAGGPPFGHRSLIELANAHLTEEPRDPGQGRDDLPPGVSWAILHALSKEPENRPPTGTALANMLASGRGPSTG